MQQWKYAFFEITGWLYSSGSTACVGFGGCLVCTQQWSTAVLLYPRHYSDNSCGRLCGKYKKNEGPHIMSLFCDTQLYLFLRCCSYLNSIVTLHLTGIFLLAKLLQLTVGAREFLREETSTDDAARIFTGPLPNNSTRALKWLLTIWI